MNRRRTLEQNRAQRALEMVGAVKNVGGDLAKEYCSLAKSAPADIQSNGLGQTLAFWRSKTAKKEKEKEGPHDLIYRHISQWVCQQMRGWDGGDLLSKLVDERTSLTDYRRAMEEAMAFSVWLKRFAEAELDQSQADSEELDRG